MASRAARNLITLSKCHRALDLFASSKRAPVLHRSFFGRKKESPEDTEQMVEKATSQRAIKPQEQNHLTGHNLGLLKSKRSLDTKKGYKPPPDVEERTHQVLKKLGIQISTDNWKDTSLMDPSDKFQVVTALMTEFSHDVPNTELHAMNTVQHAIDFFSTEIKQTSHYEDLASLDLPPNLHIQQEYVRFDPETDTMFNGMTAFPRSNTIITSIKYKRKYKNVRDKREIPGYANHYYH